MCSAAYGEEADHNFPLSGKECYGYAETFIGHNDIMLSGDRPQMSAAIWSQTLDGDRLEEGARELGFFIKFAERSAVRHGFQVYYSKCHPGTGDAVVWFKINEGNGQYVRLYVLFDEYKIATISREMASYAERIDKGKMYLEINPDR